MPGPAGIQRILDIFRAFYRSIKKMTLPNAFLRLNSFLNGHFFIKKRLKDLSARCFLGLSTLQ